MNVVRSPGTSARAAFWLLALLVLGRLVIAGLTPLAPDEAYYALWARDLSAGYFDHPPLIAFFIRAGTSLFGETPLGVRLFCVLSVIPTSFFVWRAAAILLADPRAAALAALFFNVTLLGYFGMVVATPDAPLVLFAAAMVYCAARLTTSDALSFWIAMGIATGLAFEAKYSAALLAAGFSVAVLIIPAWRRQLLGPKPWLALAVAILVFAPNIAWNATHGWATFFKQGGRVTEEQPFAPRFLLELAGAQLGLLTPFLCALAVLGLLPAAAAVYRSSATRRLLLAFVLVPTAYFVFHALRARVEGNWPGFLYPALAIAAAAAASQEKGSVRHFLSRFAVPVAVAIVIIGSLYVVVGPLPSLGRKDPILRTTRGWNELASEIRVLAQKNGASYLVTYDYQINAELALLLPELKVAQANDRERYATLDQPGPEAFRGTGLMLLRAETPADFAVSFATITPLGTVDQRYGDTVITPFRIYRIDIPPGS